MTEDEWTDDWADDAEFVLSQISKQAENKPEANPKTPKAQKSKVSRTSHKSTKRKLTKDTVSKAASDVKDNIKTKPMTNNKETKTKTKTKPTAPIREAVSTPELSKCSTNNASPSGRAPQKLESRWAD